MSGARPRVAVLYNAPTLPPDHPDAISEADVVAVAHTISAALNQGGFDAPLLGAAPPIGNLVEQLTAAKPDLVFNLVESFEGRSRGEAHITALLELLRLPYTGCPPEALALCCRKATAKALFRGLGLPTAPSAVLGPGDPLPTHLTAGPVIVKPEAEDASLGIDQGSVVTSPDELAKRIAWVRERYGPYVLVEAYLPGPEFNLGMLALPEPEALPVAQIDFQASIGTWPIVTYAAKWDMGSVQERGTPVLCPAPIGPGLADRLRCLAVSAFRATSCRDYARVDFRLDERGEPMILEVNPNPDLGPGAGWARAVRVSGRNYEETLVALARQALERGSGPSRHAV